MIIVKYYEIEIDFTGLGKIYMILYLNIEYYNQTKCDILMLMK